MNCPVGASQAFKNPAWFVVEAVMLPGANYRGVKVEDMTFDQLTEAVQVLGRDLKRLSLMKHQPVRHAIVERFATDAASAFPAFQNPARFVVEAARLPSADYDSVKVEDMDYDQLAEAVQVLGQDLKRLSLMKHRPARYSIVEKMSE